MSAAIKDSSCVDPALTVVALLGRIGHGSEINMYETVAEMLAALDAWLLRYNRERRHQGRGINGRTPWQAFLDGLPARPQPQPENKPQPIAA